MAMQMNKEKDCMNALRSHFENAIIKLEEKVNVLNSERHTLLTKLENKEKKANGKNYDRMSKAESERMQNQITELEVKIKELKLKSNEHAKSLRLREKAERK